jgi:hypothetical protein
MAALGVPVRMTAVSLALSGALVASALPLHPSILDRPVGAVVRTTPLWGAIHLAAMVAVVLAAVGACGFVAVHRGALGRLGRSGLVFTLVGSYSAVAVFASEALVFPMLAARAPALLDLQGPLVSVPYIGLAALSSCWPIGLALLGVAAARARVFPRVAGLALAVTALAFLGLGVPFVPVLDVISEVLFGAAQVWWGWLLWRAAPVPIADLPSSVGRRGDTGG